MVAFDPDAPTPPTTSSILKRLADNSRRARSKDLSGRAPPPSLPTVKKKKKKKKNATKATTTTGNSKVCKHCQWNGHGTKASMTCTLFTDTDTRKYKHTDDGRMRGKTRQQTNIDTNNNNNNNAASVATSTSPTSTSASSSSSSIPSSTSSSNQTSFSSSSSSSSSITTDNEDDFNWVRCDSTLCLKWRKVPIRIDVNDLDEEWMCGNSTWSLLSCQDECHCANDGDCEGCKLSKIHIAVNLADDENEPEHEEAAVYEYPLCLQDCKPGTDPKTWPLLKTQVGRVFKDIFLQLPMAVTDNYYGGEPATDFIITIGGELVTTTGRGRLPVPKHLLHSQKLQDSRGVKDARHYPPVVILSNERPRWGHISMQSTGPLNLSFVGSFGEINNYISKRKRGKKDAWTRNIEMNEIREFYLKYYGVIDRADARSQRMHLRLVAHRNSVNPLLNGIQFVISALAYDMYVQIVNGHLPGAPAEWQDPKGAVTADEFMMGVSLQMMQFTYRSTYPGETEFRENRKRSRDAGTAQDDTNVSAAAKKSKKTLARTHHEGAICSSIQEFALDHVSTVANSSPRCCLLCGAKTYSACSGCKVMSGRSEGNDLPLCTLTFKNKNKTSSSSSSSSPQKQYDCHTLYHLSLSSGNGRCDVDDKKNWDRTREKRMDAMLKTAMDR